DDIRVSAGNSFIILLTDGAAERYGFIIQHLWIQNPFYTPRCVMAVALTVISKASGGSSAFSAAPLPYDLLCISEGIHCCGNKAGTYLKYPLGRLINRDLCASGIDYDPGIILLDMADLVQLLCRNFSFLVVLFGCLQLIF